MKNLRRIIFTSCLVLALVAISVVCFIVGRGHTIYFDNSALEGTEYAAYNEISIMHDGKAVGKMIEKERLSLAVTGQKLEVEIIAKKEVDGAKKNAKFELDIPYDMDNIMINVPAYLDGASQDIYMEEFIPANEALDDEEVPQTDEFGLSVDE